MKNDSIKKYLIPNIPYLFVLWAFLKLGTAYRLAAGADFAHKLMGLGQTIGPAFADFAPGLAPFDWLVGIVGAVAFRVMVYVKSKNAKKFRRDEEYGSARWGCPKDIAPFVDPKFENNIILTGTEFLTMNTRPKNPANARNLNACVIGSSGSGKTRFWLTPQILQASADKNGGCSYVCVDPKGGVLGQVGHFLQKRGYRIKVFNSIDFTKSMHYNPLAYIRNEADILKFVDALISNTKGEGKEGDPFWTKSETLLYCALIAYIIFEGPAEDRNMNTLVDMISGMEVKEDDEDFMNAVDYMFAGLEKHKTLEGCPVLSAEEIGKLQSSMASDWRKNPVPYPSYLLTNNNANIRRTRQRIEDLKSQSEYAGWAFPGGRAEINEGENRLQLFFEEKPSEEQRRELKSNGFKWAPSQGAWQRQLTKNAIYAAGRMEFLRPEDGQSPYQLQPFARKTEKDMTR